MASARFFGLILAFAAAPLTAMAAGDETPKSPDSSRPAAHAEGDYGGVNPGEGEKAASVVRRGKFPRLTWVGFLPEEDGRSRIFVQLDREVEYSQRIEKGALVVSITGARFAARNHRRYLDMRYFDNTSLRHLKSRRVRKRRARGDRPARAAGIELSFYFKNPGDLAEASASMSTAADGYTYLFLDFGPPSVDAGDTSDE